MTEKAIEAAAKTIPALIEKLRGLKGPDREVDAEIMFDLFAVPIGKKGDGGPSGYLWPEDSPSWSFGIRFPGKDREWFADVRKGSDKETLLIERDGALVLMNDLRIPPLTASLDAVTALIMREMPKCLCDMNTFGAAAIYPNWLIGDVDTKYAATAETPALALLIAFLEAKMEIGNDHT